jgi:hypothetical protein
VDGIQVKIGIYKRVKTLKVVLILFPLKGRIYDGMLISNLRFEKNIPSDRN